VNETCVQEMPTTPVCADATVGKSTRTHAAISIGTPVAIDDNPINRLRRATRRRTCAL